MLLLGGRIAVTFRALISYTCAYEVSCLDKHGGMVLLWEKRSRYDEATASGRHGVACRIGIHFDKLPNEHSQLAYASSHRNRYSHPVHTTSSRAQLQEHCQPRSDPRPALGLQETSGLGKAFEICRG